MYVPTLLCNRREVDKAIDNDVMLLTIGWVLMECSPAACSAILYSSYAQSSPSSATTRIGPPHTSALPLGRLPCTCLHVPPLIH